MSDANIRATVYFDPDLHKALRLKAATEKRSLSDLINEAVRESLAEDEADLRAFEMRVGEPTMTYEDLLKSLKQRGKL